MTLNNGGGLTLAFLVSRTVPSRDLVPIECQTSNKAACNEYENYPIRFVLLQSLTLCSRTGHLTADSLRREEKKQPGFYVAKCNLTLLGKAGKRQAVCEGAVQVAVVSTTCMHLGVTIGHEWGSEPWLAERASNPTITS